MSEVFDKDYFENGVEKHISGYTNYRWRPEYVMPMANWLKQKFNYINVFSDPPRFLDYGCAKGFLVKALRLMDCEAYGYDVSQYAIDNAEFEVKDYCFNTLTDADIVIAKDVLEHVPESAVPNVIDNFTDLGASFVIAIIPLGDDNKFRIREYELDVTHVTKKDEVWWINQFKLKGYSLDEFYYSIPGIKDNWTTEHPYGNGIFIFKKV